MKLENIKTEIVSAVVKQYEVSTERYLQIKEQIKKEAKDLRTLKLAFKDCQRGIHKGTRVNEYDVSNAKWNFRVRHAAYCMLKGRTLQEIENDADKKDTFYLEQEIAKAKLGFINA